MIEKINKAKDDSSKYQYNWQTFSRIDQRERERERETSVTRTRYIRGDSGTELTKIKIITKEYSE